MYSRPTNRDPRIPPNYGGSIFSRNNTVTPVEDLTHRRTQSSQSREEPYSEEEDRQDAPHCDTEQTELPEEDICHISEEKHSLLSPLGSLGTEELLLIALALIIFQDGKNSELALILLALLFIN